MPSKTSIGSRPGLAWVFSIMEQFPGIVADADQRIIEYLGILRAGGFLAWIDVELNMVAELLGEAVRVRTAEFVLSDRPRKRSPICRASARPLPTPILPFAAPRSLSISATGRMSGSICWPPWRGSSGAPSSVALGAQPARSRWNTATPSEPPAPGNA